MERTDADGWPQEAHDSGVSTIDSSCSLQLQLQPPSGRESFAEILMNEHNNNVSAQMDVVKLLSLKSTDEEEQHSNSSSLESINSLRNHQGSEERDNDNDDDEEGSGSTSCSEDSFEMSSACSVRQSIGLTRDSRETTCDSFDDIQSPAASNATINECGFVPCKPSSSYSVDSFINAARNPEVSYPSRPPPSSFDRIRHRVAHQIDHLDTGLPSLDFAKLEKQLKTAAQEREEHERRMLGEEVRRRLAFQVDSHVGPSPQVYTKPHRSNLALRLQTAMNLQVCYMNEMSDSETEHDDSDDSDTDVFVRKSKSAPNLKDSCKSTLRQTQQMKALTERIQRDDPLAPEERMGFLRNESQRVLQIARGAAEKALADYRRGKSRASDVPRQARQYLSKKKVSEIDSIRELIENAIARKNMELVQLLLERDSLHMEHDSLRVDIDDFTQHEAQATALDLGMLVSKQEKLAAGEIDLQPQRQPIRNPVPPKAASTTAAALRERPKTKSTTPVTPLTTPTSPTLSFASVIPSSFNIIPFFRR